MHPHIHELEKHNLHYILGAKLKDHEYHHKCSGKSLRVNFLEYWLTDDAGNDQGDSLGHKYGIGRKYLSAVFDHLMLLAFLIDQVRQMCCPLVFFKSETNRI
ncbi:MAG: hypothetical protein CSA33_05970 [Desulfobulbus propionicus]|nr:MAG: hypothetical protein CSA33_05970 [Desulfobulbus propionicus]